MPKRDFSDVDRLARAAGKKLDLEERERHYRQPPAWALRARKSFRRLAARLHLARGVRPLRPCSLLLASSSSSRGSSHGPA